MSGDGKRKTNDNPLISSTELMTKRTRTTAYSTGRVSMQENDAEINLDLEENMENDMIDMDEMNDDNNWEMNNDNWMDIEDFGLFDMYDGSINNTHSHSQVK